MNVRALKFLLVFKVLDFESANLFENSAINIKYIKTPLSGKTVKPTQICLQVKFFKAWTFTYIIVLFSYLIHNYLLLIVHNFPILLLT